MAQVSGVVYKDFNGDGVRSYTVATPLAGEIGIGGITVNLYSSTGLVATTTTSSATGTAAGTYSFTAGITSGTIYRVEFVNLPTGSFDGAKGTNSGTSVQFVTAPSTTASLGINDPADYCQAIPNFFIPCYVNGNPTGGGTAGPEGVLVTLPYNATSPTGTTTGNTPQESAIALNNQLGTVYGVAYQRQTKYVFTSAFVKRHSGLGGDGAAVRAGTIYISKPSGTTYTHSQFVTLPTAISAVSAASIGGTTVVGSNTDRGLPSAVTAANYDVTVFDQVGKAGLGDVEISDDGTELYVVNLGDRRLYRIPIINPTSANPTAGTPVSYTLPAVTQATGSAFRPFGLKYYRDRIYVGGVTTNEAVSTTLSMGEGMVVRDTTGMKGYVFEFNPATATFTTVLTFPLTYQKGATNNDLSGVQRADRWFPWTHVQAATGRVPNRYARPSSGAGSASYPQPMLTGIEFDPVDGAMILSIRDRFGDQYGNNNYGTNTSSGDLYRAISPGDILRAGKCNPSVNQWTIENNARTCNGTPTAGANNGQGIGGGEYYYADAIALPNTTSPYHSEMSTGSLVVLPGRGEVASAVMDPTNNIDAGGIRRFRNADGFGAPTTSVQIYESNNVATYGKANGLGDLEIGCDLAPVQIGNRVWRDNNNNGIQDPGEPSLAGVQVTLRSGSTVIATATTDANGEYFFSTATATTTSSSVYNLTLTAGGSYTLSFPTSVSAFSVSTFPNSATGANADAIDSDADAAGLVTFTLGQSGENNFTFDVGYACTPLALTLTSATICAGQTASLTATSGFSSYTFSSGLTQVGSTNVATGTATGTYSVTAINSAGCSGTAVGSITVNSLPIVSLSSATICAGQSTTLTATPGFANYTFPAGLTRIGSTNQAVGSTAGTYSVTAVSAAGCIGTGSGSITVNALPTVSLTSATICAGQPATLTATAGLSSYTLISSTGSILTNATGVFSVTPASATSYTVTGQNSSGCSATATGGITVTPVPVATATSTTITCNSPATVTGSSSLTGSTYAWTGPGGFSSSQQSFTTSIVGTYTLIVSSNGCSSTAVTTTVQSNTAAPTVSINSLTLTCAQPTGTLTATTSNSATSTYRWSTGETTASIPVISAGLYSVTVTGANGCTASTSTTVQSNTTVPSVSVNSLTLTCAQPSGTLTATVSATANPTYRWNTGATTASINVTSAGPYSVTVTGGNGCVTTAATTVQSNTVVPTVSVNSLTLSCGQPTGSLTATTSNSATSTYRWSTGETTASIPVISAGLYSVTVTGANGCTASTSTTVQSNTAVPTVSINSLTLSCGQPSGTLTATVSATASPTYRWSTGETTASISVSVAGPYSVTVAGSNGCVASAVTLVQSDTSVPIVTINSLTLTCAQLAGDLTATVSNAVNPTYRWSTGETTASINVASAGPYSVTVTDANGCISAATSTVVSNTLAPAVSVNSLTLTCAQPNGTLTATVSNAVDATYRWSTGETTASISVSVAGAYSVTVTEANGCASTVATIVQSNTALPTITLNSLTLTCAQTSGTLSATVSNALNPAYQWSTGETTTAIIAASAGPYSVTVTSANGCVVSATTTVQSDGNVPTVSVNSLTLTCAQPVGTLTATVSDAINPTYLWSTGETTASISATAGGAYSVTVTGGNGCMAMATTTVQSDTAIPTVTVNSLTLTCGQPSGTLTAQSGNATNPTYLWSTGETSQTITVAAAGPYSVTVTGENGCEAAASSTVQSDGTVPTVSVNNVVLTCAQTSGILSATVGSAVNPVYRWSTGETTTSISVSAAGPYSVTVTSSNGCFATITTTVQSDTDAPAVTIAGNTTLCQGEVTSLTATGGDTYVWSTGDVTNPIFVATSGTYSVTATNANGCTSTTVVTVQVNPIPVLTLSSVPVCDGQLASLTASAGFDRYVFSTGLTQVGTTNVATATVSGTYSVTGITSAGCSATATGTATVNPLPVASIAVSSATICEGTSATLTAGGGATYAWSTGQATPSIEVVDSGVYSVTVTSVDGCSDVASATITVAEPLALTVNSATVCSGQSATLTVGGCQGGIIAWSTGESTASIVVTPALSTTYSVNCTSPSGCVSTTSTVVTVNAVPTITAAPQAITATCTGATANNDARINLTGLVNAERADIVLGSSYGNGPAYGAPTNLTVVAGAVSFTNLPNPGSSQPYTIRLYSSNGTCYTDVTVILEPAYCNCPPPKCIPFVIQQTRGPKR
jgi:hypothetical protein